LHHRRAWVDLAKADQPVALHALAARVALVVRVHLVRLVPAVLHAQVSQILVRLVPVRLRARLRALLAQAQALAEAAVAASAAEQQVPSVEVAAKETVPESQSARNEKSTSRDRPRALVAL
jgi:hypothetical protein